MSNKGFSVNAFLLGKEKKKKDCLSLSLVKQTTLKQHRKCVFIVVFFPDNAWAASSHLYFSAYSLGCYFNTFEKLDLEQ